jgi:hypothetical protein
MIENSFLTQDSYEKSLMLRPQRNIFFFYVTPISHTKFALKMLLRPKTTITCLTANIHTAYVHMVSGELQRGVHSFCFIEL